MINKKYPYRCNIKITKIVSQLFSFTLMAKNKKKIKIFY